MVARAACCAMLPVMLRLAPGVGLCGCGPAPQRMPLLTARLYMAPPRMQACEAASEAPCEQHAASFCELAARQD